MPNTSSSVPFLLTSSMQSIRSRRPSTCLSSGPLGSGSGFLQQIGSNVVRFAGSYSGGMSMGGGGGGGGGGFGGSGTISPAHHHQHHSNTNNPFNMGNMNGNYDQRRRNSSNQLSNPSYHVRKCPSLNITFSS